jgi:non-ribosomal peptide synthase protein (TIGR01720 family)
MIGRAVVTSYNLSRGPLFKAVIFEQEAGRPRLLFLTAHFYPVDLGSWLPLLDDFDTTYGQIVAGDELQLQPKTTSTIDWAKRLQQRALDLPADERRYWMEQAPKQPTRIPMDHETGPNDWTAARVERMTLNAEDTEILLSHAPRAFGAQIDGIMVTAILEAFARWVGAREFPIILLGHGREPLFDDMDISRTVGWFNSLFPINVKLGPEVRFDEEARFVNEQLRKVPHGGMGYGILKYLGGDQEAARHLRESAWPQIFFNYVGSDNAKELRSFKKIEQFGGYFLDIYTKRLAPIALTGMIVEDELLLKWEWSVHRHDQETILALVERCREVIDWFLTEYRRRQAARGVVE